MDVRIYRTRLGFELLPSVTLALINDYDIFHVHHVIISWMFFNIDISSE